MIDDESLRGIAERLAIGRDSAFPELVAALEGNVFSGVVRLTGDRHDAEEITQEAFVRAFRALGRYDRDQVRDLRLRPWLWTIALNLCRNRARDRSRRPATVTLDRQPEPPGPDSTEEAAIETVDDAWQERLEALPAHVGTAVVLRHVVGLAYAEIAETVGRPVGTVKSDVHRGVARLRAMLIEEGVSV